MMLSGLRYVGITTPPPPPPPPHLLSDMIFTLLSLILLTQDNRWNETKKRNTEFNSNGGEISNRGSCCNGICYSSAALGEFSGVFKATGTGILPLCSVIHA